MYGKAGKSGKGKAATKDDWSVYPWGGDGGWSGKGMDWGMSAWDPWGYSGWGPWDMKGMKGVKGMKGDYGWDGGCSKAGPAKGGGCWKGGYGGAAKGGCAAKGCGGKAGGGKAGGAKGGGGAGSSSKKVFVGGLPKGVSEDSVRQYFDQFGPIEELKMMYDNQGDSRGYAFVIFSSLADAQKVYDNYEANEVEGTWVDCKASEGSKAKPGDWYCGMCGDLVFASRASCHMCGYAGPLGMPVTQHANAKPGDWQCPGCGDLVFASKETCNKCGKGRGKSTSRMNMKKGDWICPNCGDLVFASKDACSMCGTAKRGGGDGGENGWGQATTGKGKARFSPY